MILPRAFKILDHNCALVGEPPHLWKACDTNGDLKANQDDLSWTHTISVTSSARRRWSTLMLRSPTRAMRPSSRACATAASWLSKRVSAGVPSAKRRLAAASWIDPEFDGPRERQLHIVVHQRPSA